MTLAPGPDARSLLVTGKSEPAALIYCPFRTLPWWATKNEWLGLLDVSGLQLEALYGGFNQEPFHDNSPEYVFVARR